MRRCYKCGAKMTTDYIVCEDCEKKLNVAKDLENQMTDYIRSQDVPSLIEVVIKAINKAEKGDQE